MKKITIKVPAKINITLDVTGVKDGYHQIKSLVSAIDLYDKITVTERNDYVINLVNKGIQVDCNVVDNNAYKSAKMFMETFKTKGVNIVIDKKIPLSSGLGGSSADIVGVIKGMKAIYNIDSDMTDILNRLGSDTAYMYKGGYAVICGRGEIIHSKKIDKELYLLLITHDKSISARESYEKFDSFNEIKKPCTDKVLFALRGNDFEEMKKYAKNDLYPASVTIVKEMEDTINDLKKEDAISLMTGSGSGVYGIFSNKRKRDNAYKNLLSKYNGRIYKVKTLK